MPGTFHEKRLVRNLPEGNYAGLANDEPQPPSYLHWRNCCHQTAGTQPSFQCPVFKPWGILQSTTPQGYNNHGYYSLSTNINHRLLWPTTNHQYILLTITNTRTVSDCQTLLTIATHHYQPDSYGINLLTTNHYQWLLTISTINKLFLPTLYITTVLVIPWGRLIPGQKPLSLPPHGQWNARVLTCRFTTCSWS